MKALHYYCCVQGIVNAWKHKKPKRRIEKARLEIHEEWVSHARKRHPFGKHMLPYGSRPKWNDCIISPREIPRKTIVPKVMVSEDDKIHRSQDTERKALVETGAAQLVCHDSLLIRVQSSPLGDDEIEIPTPAAMPR